MSLARHRSYLVFLSLAAVLAVVETWVVTSAWFPHSPDLLAFAVTADVALGIPALYYLLLVRGRHSPVITLAPVFLVALVLAQLILPPASHMYLARLAVLVPVVEGVVLVYGVRKARAVVRQFRQIRPITVYASDALEASLRHTFGASPLIGVLVTELSLPYYVICGWFQRYTTTVAGNVAISCYRTSGYGAVISMFTSLIVLETTVVHVLLQHWSSTGAWILTALSCYSLVWGIGDYQAVRLHPLVLSRHTLYIRTGVRWRVDITWTQITALRRAVPGRVPRQHYLNAAVYGEPRFLLHLNEPVVAYGLFGMRKHVRHIGLSVDDAALFQREVHQRLGHDS